MSEDFLPDPRETSNPPDSSNADSEASPRREPIKMLLIGSPQAVNTTIRNLYKRGFAEVKAWSSLQPTNKPGDVMSILSREIWIN